VILLADENVQRTVVDSLRQKGHVVHHVQEMTPGVPDDTVLEMATHESAILLTYDRDFGELVFRQKRIARGVILVRFPGLPPVRVAELVSATISAHGEEIDGAFTVIGPRGSASAVSLRPPKNSHEARTIVAWMSKPQA